MKTETQSSFWKEYSIIFRWLVLEAFMKGYFALGIRSIFLSVRLARYAVEAKKNADTASDSPFIYTMQ